MHRREAQLSGYGAERREAVGAAELLGQRVPVPQPFNGVVQRQLCSIDHAIGRPASAGHLPDCRACFYRDLRA